VATGPLLVGPRGVDGDSVEPGRERRIPPKIGQRLPCPDQGLLGDICRQMRISYQSPRQRIDLISMLTHQGRKGGSVAGLCPGDELLFLLPFDL